MAHEAPVVGYRLGDGEEGVRLALHQHGRRKALHVRVGEELVLGRRVAEEGDRVRCEVTGSERLAVDHADFRVEARAARYGRMSARPARRPGVEDGPGIAG